MGRRVDFAFNLSFIDCPFPCRKIRYGTDQKAGQKQLIRVGHFTDKYDGRNRSVWHSSKKACHAYHYKGSGFSDNTGHDLVKNFSHHTAHCSADYYWRAKYPAAPSGSDGKWCSKYFSDGKKKQKRYGKLIVKRFLSKPISKGQSLWQKKADNAGTQSSYSRLEVIWNFDRFENTDETIKWFNVKNACGYKN